jgi:hypothetical protein
MVRADTKSGTESRKRDSALVDMRIQQLAGTLDDLRLRIDGTGAIRSATATGPKSGLTSRLTRLKEDDLRPIWAAGRAGRPAIDAGGTHRVDKLAVRGSVPMEHGLPKDLFVKSHAQGLRRVELIRHNGGLRNPILRKRSDRFYPDLALKVEENPARNEGSVLPKLLTAFDRGRGGMQEGTCRSL